MVSRPATLALLAVACLVLAGSAPAAPSSSIGAAASQFDSDRSANWVLELDGEPIRSDVVTPGLDVAQSLETQRSAASIRLREITLQRRLQAASTDERRFEILTDEVEALGARLRGLYSAEQSALAGYRQGQLSADEYLSRTAFLHARTQQYLETISVIEDEGERLQAAAISRSVQELRTRAAVIGGPVQEHAAATYEGASSGSAIRVEVGTEGYVASYVVDGELVRQSHRYGLRTESGSTNDVRTVIDHIYSQYPDETNQSPSISVGGQQSAGVFFLTITTSSSVRVTSFVDNRNLTIFKEVYRQPLTQLSFGRGVTATEDDVRLVVDHATAADLLRIRTTADGTGDPVDAAVFFGGTRVGSTGLDGELWVVAPGNETAINANTGSNQTVSIQHQPNA